MNRDSLVNWCVAVPSAIITAMLVRSGHPLIASSVVGGTFGALYALNRQPKGVVTPDGYDDAPVPEIAPGIAPMSLVTDEDLRELTEGRG